MKEREAQLAAEVAELLERAREVDPKRKTGGTAKTSVEMSCRRSWLFERVGWRRYGKPWRRWKPRRRRLPNRPRPKVVSVRGVPDDKAQRNFTDTESRIIPAPGGKDFLQAYNCQAVVDSAHQVIVAARATNQTSDKQQAAADDGGDHRQRRRSPQGSIRRCWLLLGKGSQRALRSGRGPVRRAGADPPRPGCATRAPRSHTQPSVSQMDRMRRKLQTRRGRQRYALRMQTVEPVFGQIKQGRGFRQFLPRGLEKVNGEWSS